MLNFDGEEEESDSSSDEDDDEDDFDIYAMIRSKSCNKKSKKEEKSSDSDNSEESEEKKSESEEGDDIESVLYGKEPKNIFMNIDMDNVEDKNSIIRCIDFDEIFLTSSNMFTDNVDKNNLYSKYILKFDEIYDKVLLKIKEKKKLFNNIKKVNEKENQTLNQSEVTEDNSSS